MKNLYIKILIIISLIALVLWQGRHLNPINFIPTARAVGDLMVDWGLGVPPGSPIFTITDFLPGDSVSRIVTVSNGSAVTRPLGIRGTKTSGSDALSSALLLTILQNGSPVYQHSLAQFFTDSINPNFVQFADLAPNTSAAYTFQVSLPSSVNSPALQNQSVVFNLIIGISFSIPQACQSINFDGKIIYGTSGNDNLTGTPGNDIILGFEGNDNIEGNSGNDCLLGGPGDDKINGNNGEDYIDGGPGDNRLNGNNGTDTCINGASKNCEN